MNAADFDAEIRATSWTAEIHDNLRLIDCRRPERQDHFGHFGSIFKYSMGT